MKSTIRHQTKNIPHRETRVHVQAHLGYKRINNVARRSTKQAVEEKGEHKKKHLQSKT